MRAEPFNPPPAPRSRLVAQAAHLRRLDGSLLAQGAVVVYDGEIPEIITFEGVVFARCSFGLAVEIYRETPVFRADVCFQRMEPA